MNLSRILGIVAALAVVSVVFVGIFGTFVKIDDGERGVLLRNGKAISVLEPGLNWLIPFIDDVKTISIRENKVAFEDLQAYSFDQQVGILQVSVNYNIPNDKILEVYREYGTEEFLISKLVSPKVKEQVKTVFGKYGAAKIVNNREVVSMDATKALRAAVDGPVNIDSVQIENVDFSAAFDQGNEDKQLSEVKVQLERNNLEKEKVLAEQAVTQAKGRADSVRIEAEGRAAGIRALGEAEAYAIQVKTDALNSNPMVVELTKAERWDGKLPTTMLPNSAVPFIDAAGKNNLMRSE